MLSVSYAISLLMAMGAYRVVTLCVQLLHDMLAIAKFLVSTRTKIFQELKYHRNTTADGALFTLN